MCNISDDLPPRANNAFEPEVESMDVDLGRNQSPHEHEASSLFSHIAPEITAAVRLELRERVNDIPVEIEVVIGRTKISVAELTRLDPGHEFRLDKRFGEPIELLVNGRLIGHGEIVGDHDDNVIGVRMIRLAG